MSRSNTRRDFLKTSAAAAAAAVPYFSWSAPSIAQDAKTESKNDRPILGCIGTGDRWNAVGPQAMNFADCVAVCDVDSEHAAKGKTRSLEQNAEEGPRADGRGLRGLSQAARPQGHRRRDDRHARPLAHARSPSKR